MTNGCSAQLHRSLYLLIVLVSWPTALLFWFTGPIELISKQAAVKSFCLPANSRLDPTVALPESKYKQEEGEAVSRSQSADSKNVGHRPWTAETKSAWASVWWELQCEPRWRFLFHCMNMIFVPGSVVLADRGHMSPVKCCRVVLALKSSQQWHYPLKSYFFWFKISDSILILNSVSHLNILDADSSSHCIYCYKRFPRIPAQCQPLYSRKINLTNVYLPL